MNLVEAKKQKIEYLSYIIGLLSIIILGKLIGNNGVAYMAAAIECISFFALAAGGGGAEMIGRLIRSRRKKNQYREAAQLHKAVWITQGSAALIIMAVYFFLTDLLAEGVFGLPFMSVALKILTPVILLRVVQNVIMGYFQGMGSHMPTVVSSVFRQLLFLLFGLLLTGRLTAYGEKVSALLNNADYAGMYGAVALCLAILIAEILVSLFLLIVYLGSDRKKEKKKAEDGFQKMDSFGESSRLLCMMSVPEAGMNILKKLPFLLGILLFLRKAESISAAADSYGVFFRGFVCFSAVFVFLITAGMLNSICKLTGAVKMKENRSVREAIYAGLHYSWVTGLYAAVCLAVMAPGLSRLLEESSTEVLHQYYLYGAASVLLLTVNIYLCLMLQAMGAGRANLISLLLLNTVFAGSYLILTGKKMDGITALCVAALIGLLVQLLFSFILAIRKYSLQPDLIRGVVVPVVGAGAMGLAVMLVQNLLSPHLGNIACLLLCTAVSIIVYMAVLLLTGSITQSEISCVFGPVGRKIFKMLLR